MRADRRYASGCRPARRSAPAYGRPHGRPRPAARAPPAARSRTLDAGERARHDASRAGLLEAGLGFNDLHVVHLGDRLASTGRWPRPGRARPPMLAQATGTHERLRARVGSSTRPWGRSSTSSTRPRRATSLRASRRPRRGPARPRQPGLHGGVRRMMVGCARPLPSVLEAFRGGAGVPYADYPPTSARARAT